MDETVAALSTPAGIAVAAVLAGCILVAAVKLIWGAALWSKKSEYRLGQSWAGAHVDVVEWSGEEGYVRAGGELWKATSTDGLAPGDKVAVVSAKGLVLEVRKS